jgi:hypothetical protein
MADEPIKTFVKVPEGSMLVEVVEVVSYLDKEGDRYWNFRMDGDTPVSSTIGLLEMVKNRILTKYVGP